MTRPKEIADAAIAMYNLPDWSRSSQIALLSRTMSTRFESFWDWQNYKTLIASKYSEVSAMSEEGIVVRAGVLDPAQFDRISEHGDEAVAYIYQDNPLIVIAARTLGIPLDIYLYDLTRLGTKSNLLIQPESL